MNVFISLIEDWTSHHVLEMFDATSKNFHNRKKSNIKKVWFFPIIQIFRHFSLYFLLNSQNQQILKYLPSDKLLRWTKNQHKLILVRRAAHVFFVVFSSTIIYWCFVITGWFFLKYILWLWCVVWWFGLLLSSRSHARLTYINISE